MADGIVTRGHVVVSFTDQYGEERVIHRQRGTALRIKKRSDTISHTLNRAAAELTGDRIKALRLERGLTLEELAVRAGLCAATGQHKNRMWEIENAGRTIHRNKQGVRFGTLYALALALEVDVARLMPTTKEVARKAGVELAPARIAQVQTLMAAE